MHLLSIDLGERRTGFASGDDVTGLVTPGAVVECGAGEALLEEIARRVREHGPDAIVLGLPLNMDATEGEPARAVRAFGARIAERTGLPVHYQDERLTSFAADQRMARTGRTHGQKRRRRDAIAAAQILEDWLSAGGAEGRAGDA